ncbi:MAG: hypothetical protein HY783_06230, partial [Chloroflexi bacterium]|nr:hypothetical protein [Chloroflexota bacterium]
MAYTLAWLGMVEVLGLLTLPVAFRFFPNLPDRGYSFSRPLGILLFSYIFWLLAMFGVLENTLPTLYVLLFVVTLVSGVLWRQGRQAITAFLHQQGRGWLAAESVFLGAFLLWAVVRAYNPEITATEKPMELAFLNGILRSQRFPPLDPWLSGYSISYYYFGYLMVATLTRLSGVPSSVAFNLAIATLFALTVSGAYGIVYNLVARWEASRREPEPGSPDVGTPTMRPVAYGLLGAGFVSVIGNLEGFLEMLHTRGLGSGALWKWIDVTNLLTHAQTGAWLPRDNWWWWAASRVLHDSFLGARIEIIDEFPFFSFMLGDMHPHVLALPFTLLAVAIALNVFLSQEDLGPDWLGRNQGLFFLMALCLGALGFLNTWDLPSYFGLFALAYGAQRYRHRGRLDQVWLREVVLFLSATLLVALVLFIPYYIGFQSQAGGPRLSIFWKTKLRHFAIFFGFFLFIIFGLLAQAAGEWRQNVGSWFGGLNRWLAGAVLVAALAFSLVGWYVAALSLVLLAVTAGLWAWSLSDASRAPLAFTLLLVLLAMALIFGVEFVYLDDVFHNRMNTIFKFYYQAWVMLGLAAAAGIYYVFRYSGGLWRALWLGGAGLLALMALVYPAWATVTKANGFAGEPTLDGTAYLAGFQPYEYQAIQWLNANVAGAP